MKYSKFSDLQALPVVAAATTPAARFRQAVASPKATVAHLERLAARLTLDDIRNPDQRGGTSLALAAAAGNSDIVEWLLFDEAHEEGEISRDAAGETVVHIAAAYGHVEILKMYLSQYPFVLDWTNSRGATGLHVAAMHGQLEVAQFLVESGADIEAPDLQGNTALHYATSWGKLPVIKLLVDENCDVTAKNNDGFTAAEYSFSFACLQALEEYVRAHFELTQRSKRNSRQAQTPNMPTTPFGAPRTPNSQAEGSFSGNRQSEDAASSPGVSPSRDSDSSRPGSPQVLDLEAAWSTSGTLKSLRRLSRNSIFAPGANLELSPAEVLRRRASNRDPSGASFSRPTSSNAVDSTFVTRPERTSSIGALQEPTRTHAGQLSADHHVAGSGYSVHEPVSDSSTSMSGPSQPQSEWTPPTRSRASSSAVDDVDGMPVLARPQMELPADDSVSMPVSRKTVRATSWSHGPTETGPRKLRRASHSAQAATIGKLGTEPSREYQLQSERLRQQPEHSRGGKLTRALRLSKKLSRASNEG
ncbi:Target of rapamycin complex 2 subunit avo2 [Microbotryomycetes sp. JL201]|nr:Target of rapamycin complex 2 subunit avo2 [Microbotryomycetes sp. JL201]